MWDGYETALAMYGIAVCHEWLNRGYKDTMLERFEAMIPKVNRHVEFPHWLGNEEFHLSHQSNLIRKFPEHYGPLFPGVPDNLEYVWPVEEKLVVLR